jgi:hypothetical protein
MIRLSKPVKLLEWGEGTNTLNQVWTEIGEGEISAVDVKNQITTLSIALKGSFAKKNQNDPSVKIVQPGEGMTARSDHWGEVAMGNVKSVEQGGKAVVIEIPTATKIDKRRHAAEMV